MQWAEIWHFFLAKAVICDLLLLLWAKGQCFLELDIYSLSHFLAVLPELIMSPVSHVPCKYNKLVIGASWINSTQNSVFSHSHFLVSLWKALNATVSSLWIWGKINVWIPCYMKSHSHSHSITPASGDQSHHAFGDSSFPLDTLGTHDLMAGLTVCQSSVYGFMSKNWLQFFRRE